MAYELDKLDCKHRSSSSICACVQKEVIVEIKATKISHVLQIQTNSLVPVAVATIFNQKSGPPVSAR